MDTDSEADEAGRRREWEGQESDVSDDENFSRGAKSIESPPESPPWGGANLDSPPASPAAANQQQEEASASPKNSECPASESSWESASGNTTPQTPESPDSPKARPSPPASPDLGSPVSGKSSLGTKSNSSKKGSSSSSPKDRSQQSSPKPDKNGGDIKTHGEDLSDVSDIESLGALSDSEDKPPEKAESASSKADLTGEDAEQLDFEAEEKEEVVETIKSSPPPPKANTDTTITANSSNGNSSAKKVVKEDLEEGELSDEGEARPEETEPRPVCRFFSRGQCTWGSSCRFVHPGVTDKGNYTMFEMVRPLVPMNAGGPMMHGGPMGPMMHHPHHMPHHPHHPMYGPPPPMDHFHRPPMPPPIDRPPMVNMGPPMFQQPQRKEEPPGESAWERGLRQAKEMIRKSSKRKETDVDFEEKKMTLSGGGGGGGGGGGAGGGQEEVDKENDYYMRPPSPFMDERYEMDPVRYNKVDERRNSREGYRERYPSNDRVVGEYYRSRSGGITHYEQYRTQYRTQGRGEHRERGPEYEYYEDEPERSRSSRKKKYTRDHDSGSQEKQYDRSPSSGTSKRYYKDRRKRSKSGGRGDEWADPWMRSKSPSRGKQHSKSSYSSSYSSSSSSRSSSYSSYSRSGSRSSSGSSRSSRSPVPRRSRKSADRRPPDKRNAGSDVERSMHMNPPAPSPRRKTSVSPQRSALSARIIAAALRSQRSESSRSSSGSDSSGSDSDSSSDSDSGSSSSRSRSTSREPPKHQSRKKAILGEKFAQVMKVKAMDALKLSGQKQQIKLNLKGRETLSERLHSMSASRKRQADSTTYDEESSPPSSSSKMPMKKTPPSRREELLKQLKAVEDAIARKRAKI